MLPYLLRGSKRSGKLALEVEGASLSAPAANK